MGDIVNASILTHLRRESHRRRTTGGKAHAVAGALAVAALLATSACGTGPDGAPNDVRKGAGSPAAEASAGEVEVQAAQGARRMPNRVAVLTWNICGIAGACPNRGEYQTEQVREITNVVKGDRSYAVVLIQEACAEHSRQLQEALGKNWVVHHRKATVLGTKKRKFICGAGAAVAMKKLPGSKFVKGPDGRSGWDVTFTGTRGLEREDGKKYHPKTRHVTQGAACLQDKGNKILACSSHFVAGGVTDYDKIQAASVKDLHRTTVDWQRGGYRTIVGGDFNINGRKNASESEKERIDPLFDGNFEADSNDRCSTRGKRGCKNGRKIDYIFFSDRGWQLRGGDVRFWHGSEDYRDRKLSDHWMLTAAVNVRHL
ncbi:endonuclease/exonuclease/phosphatase family protein [Streptomyces prasinus]